MTLTSVKCCLYISMNTFVLYCLHMYNVSECEARDSKYFFRYFLYGKMQPLLHSFFISHKSQINLLAKNWNENQNNKQHRTLNEHVKQMIFRFMRPAMHRYFVSTFLFSGILLFVDFCLSYLLFKMKTLNSLSLKFFFSTAFDNSCEVFYSSRICIA